MEYIVNGSKIWLFLLGIHLLWINFYIMLQSKWIPCKKNVLSLS